MKLINLNSTHIFICLSFLPRKSRKLRLKKFKRKLLFSERGGTKKVLAMIKRMRRIRLI